jgi:hypothetical protein
VIIRGRLTLNAGRAEIDADGEVFTAPAKYAGRMVSIELEEFTLPAFARSGPEAPAAGASQQNPAGGPVVDRQPLQRVVIPEDLEVLGQ